MKNIKIKENNIKVRRAKVKEVKSLIKDMATKVTEVANFIYNKPIEEDEFIESIPEFIIENIEFFEEYILKFTVEFNQEDFDELEFLDAIELVKEIISHNGINGGFIKSFFHNLKKTVGEVETKDEFVREIPKA